MAHLHPCISGTRVNIYSAWHRLVRKVKTVKSASCAHTRARTNSVCEHVCTSTRGCTLICRSYESYHICHVLLLVCANWLAVLWARFYTAHLLQHRDMVRDKITSYWGYMSLKSDVYSSFLSSDNQLMLKQFVNTLIYNSSWICHNHLYQLLGYIPVPVRTH